MKKCHLFKIVCALFFGTFAIYPLFTCLNTSSDTESEYLKKLGHVPVLQSGRIKTLESVARQSLLLMREKQTLKYKDKTLNPLPWLLMVIFNPVEANTIPVFLVHHPELITFLGRDNIKHTLFSYDEMVSFREKIMKEAKSILAIEDKFRSLFHKSLMRLVDKITQYEGMRLSVWLPYFESSDKSPHSELETYVTLRNKAIDAFHGRDKAEISNEEKRVLWNMIHLFKNMESLATFNMFPTSQDLNVSKHWQTAGSFFLDMIKNKDSIQSPVFKFYNDWTLYHPQGNFVSALPALKQYLEFVEQHYSQTFRLNAEYLLMIWQPFYKALVLYLLVFVFILCVWLFGKSGRFLSLVWIPFIIAFCVHFCGLLLRMYVHGRPPVTNLYSSAVFVGLAAMVLSMVIERIHRNGMGIAASSLMGFITLVIAHHLSITSDTFEAVRAVLDSNFWLSTHVVTITLGYSGMFLAGFLGMGYILAGVFTHKVNDVLSRSIKDMVYGLTAFNLIFTFVGTVLGGIWADQSWGRFWGWDPKENGALLIVLWNVIMLHALKLAWIKTRGLMVMAVAGNMITSFSWFGVNLLGVGLHSYGFMEKGWIGLILFMCSQCFIIGLGILPASTWQSHQKSST